MLSLAVTPVHAHMPTPMSASSLKAGKASAEETPPYDDACMARRRDVGRGSLEDVLPRSSHAVEAMPNEQHAASQEAFKLKTDYKSLGMALVIKCEDKARRLEERQVKREEEERAEAAWSVARRKE